MKNYLQQMSPSEIDNDWPPAKKPIDGVKKVYKSITMDGLLQINDYEEDQKQIVVGKDVIIFAEENGLLDPIETANANVVEEEVEHDIQPGDTIYQCSVCSTGFFSNAHLKQHLLDDHDALHCKICNLYFTSLAYETHQKIHVPKTENIVLDKTVLHYNCEVCALEFADKQAFNSHCMNFHAIQDTVEDFIDETMDNDDVCDTYEDLQIINEEDSNLKNEIQDDEQIVIEEYSLPMQKSSTDGKFYCSICNAVFAKQLSLNIHFNSKKCTQASFECDICQRVFAKKKNLSQHMKCHVAPTEFTCTKCQVQFKEKDQYMVHMKNQHAMAKRHKCTQCSKCKGKCFIFYLFVPFLRYIESNFITCLFSLWYVLDSQRSSSNAQRGAALFVRGLRKGIFTKYKSETTFDATQ